MIARSFLLCICMSLLRLWASCANCQEPPPRRDGPNEYVRIEIKGRLVVTKQPRSDDIVASIGGWCVSLSDKNGRPDRAKIEAAKKFDGKTVIVSGRPWIFTTPNLDTHMLFGDTPEIIKIMKVVIDASFKSVPD